MMCQRYLNNTTMRCDPQNITALNNHILNNVIGRNQDQAVIKGIQQKVQQKHFLHLIGAIEKLSDRQARVVVNDEESFAKFKVQIQPNGGNYKEAMFSFHFQLPVRYPQVAPRISCENHVYHPNIDDDGEICMSVFEDWTRDHDLTHCVQGLLCIFHNPNLDDPLSPYFCPEDDPALFARNVQIAIRGGTVDGVKFDNVCSDE